MPHQHRIDFVNSNLSVSYWLPTSTAKSPNQKGQTISNSNIHSIQANTKDRKLVGVFCSLCEHNSNLNITKKHATHFTIRMKALRCCQVADSFVCELW